MKQVRNTILSAAMVAFAMPAFAQTYILHTVNQAPQLMADAGANMTFCAGDSLDLGGNPSAVGGTAPINYAWSPPTGLVATNVANPLAIPSATITYQMLLTDAENCTSNASVTATLVTPAAAFAAVPNLLAVAFTDQSTAASTWAWDFGDGGSSTLQNPTHTYVAAGTYQVCLTINAGTGCEQLFCDSLNVVSVGLANSLPGVHVRAYPNPVTGSQIQFEVKGMNLASTIAIELYDQQGRMVLRHEGSANATIHTFGRKDLAAGTYAYRVHAGEYILGTGKLVLR